MDNANPIRIGLCGTVYRNECPIERGLGIQLVCRPVSRLLFLVLGVRPYLVGRMILNHSVYPEIRGFMYDADLIHLKKRCKETEPLLGPILEIGSYEGLSTAILSERDAKVTCIDPFSGGEDLPSRYTRTIFERNMRRLGRLKQITILESKSENALDDLLPEYRLIFIDGSHEFNHVLWDIQHCWPLLKRGGWLIADDINLGGPDYPIARAMQESGLKWKGVEGTKLGEVQKE